MLDFKFRTYIDEIKRINRMTDQEWIDSQSIGADGYYISKAQWLWYLKDCAIKEAETLIQIRKAG